MILSFVVVLVVVLLGLLASVFYRRVWGPRIRWQRYDTLLAVLNAYCYSGEGLVTAHGKHVMLYRSPSSQMVELEDREGRLRLIWRAKYFGQEMVYSRWLEQDLDPGEQLSEAQVAVEEFEEELQSHIRMVDSSELPAEMAKARHMDVEDLRQQEMQVYDSEAMDRAKDTMDDLADSDD